MPSPLMPGLHCTVYEPAGRSTVSSAEVPGPTFSRSPTMLPSGRRTYSSLTRLPAFCRRSVTVPAGRDVDAGGHAVSVAGAAAPPPPPPPHAAPRGGRRPGGGGAGGGGESE